MEWAVHFHGNCWSVSHGDESVATFMDRDHAHIFAGTMASLNKRKRGAPDRQRRVPPPPPGPQPRDPGRSAI